MARTGAIDLVEAALAVIAIVCLAILTRYAVAHFFALLHTPEHGWEWALAWQYFTDW
jgi:hypothetical protein